MTKLQYINGNDGKPQFVVLPIEEYERLVGDDDYTEIPYTSASDDYETVPNDIVQIMLRDDISLLAAWRVYRGLSQYDVADLLNTTQSAVSQWEALNSRPQKKTREKLAKIYNCTPEQLTL
ncbi:helix-turn-helix domain-containing protein [Morganella morganii]|uniref:helix-turn-helix domain-containing protein n=1 Tax=Morganella morganii TaxID=582 RepID=UPI0034E43905